MNNQPKKSTSPWGLVGKTALYILGFLSMCLLLGFKPGKGWSTWDIVWRTLVFLLGFLGICSLLNLLKPGTIGNGGGDNKPDPTENNYPWPDEDPYEDDRTTEPVRNWTDTISGVDELPQPDRNFIPPRDSVRIEPNPEDSVSQVVTGEAVVFFNSPDLKKDMTSFAQQYKAKYPGSEYLIKYYNVNTGVLLLGFPDTELSNMVDNLPAQITDIDFKVVPNEVLAESYVPSDPGFKVPEYDEYYKLIQAYDAWDVTKGSPDIKVAIIDSYFDLNHPLLKDRYVEPINIVTKTTDVFPPASCPADANQLGLYCHGSHVAALAIGAMDNGVGCSGIAPQCTWIPISIGDQMCSISLIEAILYAVYQGADVVNFSVGAAFNPDVKNLSLDEQVYLSQNTRLRGQDLWEYVVKIANDHNCTLVTAAGNDTVLMGIDAKNRSNDMIKVEAVDGKGKMTEFSNYGTLDSLDIEYSTVSAPGWNVWSATDARCTPIWESLQTKVDKQNALQEMPGTSMAAPIVAGAVALMKSKNKDLTTDDIIKVLKMTGKRTDPDKPIGPTLQIRDALDAIGGEYANFDDLMNDHNLLVGKWKSTNELDLYSHDNEKVDELWAYFIFDTPTAGRLEFHSINTSRIYKSPITVTWQSGTLSIKQHGKAVADDGDSINEDDYVCSPDENRLLKTSCRRNGQERYNFLLQKVN